MKCGRKACVRTEPPSKTPVILFWASPARDHKPARMELQGLHICAPCAADMKAEDLLSDEGKAQVEDLLRRMNKLPPDWTTAELEWAPLPS